MEEILENERINLFQYESGIINAKMEEVWNIVTNFNNLSTIAPNNNILPNINIGEILKGETRTVLFYCDNQLHEIDIKSQHKKRLE